MLPTEDSVVVAEELRRRFGLPLWQFTLSATDANRHVIRYARHVTGRRKIVVHDHCYHGSVDETFAALDAAGRTVSRRGNIGPPVDPAETTWVVEFNDVDGLERALASGEVAAVLAEPALTNVGHRAARARLPRGAARADPAPRRAAGHRRDAHPVGRARAATPARTGSSRTS